MILGANFHETLLRESIEAQKFKLQYFSRMAENLRSVGCVNTPAIATFISASPTPYPPYCLNLGESNTLNESTNLSN